MRFARACTTQLSNFKLNTRKRGSIHNEHSTDQGHSPETSGHMFKFFGTLSNILNFNFLYDCDPANSKVKQLLRNSSYSCSEIKRLCYYGNVIVFTDIVDRKVKTFDPRITTVETLMGTGKEGSNDETGETCTFAQVRGICCLQNTIFLSDVAAGMVKIVLPLTGSVLPTNPWKTVRQFWNWCSNRTLGITIPDRCCEQCFISE